MWKLLATMFVSILLLQSCVPSGTEQQVLARIDAALAVYDKSSTDWQTLLRNLSKDLASLEKSAALDVDAIIARGTAKAGVEFMCGADFIRDRVKEDLQRLADRLRGKTPSSLEPKICQIIFSPTQDEQGTITVGTTNEIAFYGYNFDVTGVKAVLVHAGGEISFNESNLVAIPTHYLLTVNTSSINPKNLNKLHFMCNLTNRQIALRWNGKPISTVNVNPAQCPPAKPAPTPAPEKRAYLVTDSLSGHLWGDSADRKYGGNCDSGFIRSNAKVSRTDGSGHCEFTGWVGEDENNCKVNVHLGASAAKSVDCSIEIFEVGKQLPAPTLQPCPCK